VLEYSLNSPETTASKYCACSLLPAANEASTEGAGEKKLRICRVACHRGERQKPMADGQNTQNELPHKTPVLERTEFND